MNTIQNYEYFAKWCVRKFIERERRSETLDKQLKSANCWHI